jgi:integrase
MTKSIQIRPPQPAALATAGQIANYHAARHAFDNYAQRMAPNTLIAQRSDLDTWDQYLRSAGTASPADFMTQPEAWQGVTFGLVSGFVRWLLAEGYALASLNRKLSTIKTYCGLASEAGAIPPDDLTLIRSVSGFSHKEKKRVDARRPQSRIGAKKAAHVRISHDQAQQLKRQPDTPQGRRDAVIMALLLDHGLRVGELAQLTVDNIDREHGLFSFYREKVSATQIHRMTLDTERALSAWLRQDALPDAPLLRKSRRGGRLLDAGMSARAITARVRYLGSTVGIDGLSAHDCRHYWATRAAAQGTSAFSLKDAGGWQSIAMPARYVESAAIANEGVIL